MVRRMLKAFGRVNQAVKDLGQVHGKKEIEEKLLSRKGIYFGPNISAKDLADELSFTTTAGKHKS